MDYANHITNHEKGKHLTYEDYVIIELRLKDGWSANAIARKELHCSPNTVRNIIKKGMTPLYNGRMTHHSAAPQLSVCYSVVCIVQRDRILLSRLMLKTSKTVILPHFLHFDST